MSDAWRRAEPSRARLIKWIAAAHLLCALGIALFWAGFYAEVIFPKELLRSRILHFEGYYAWETSFTIPDGVTACVMTWGGWRLLRDPTSRAGATLLTAASGALLFLGLLDLVYDARHGMFALGHFFSWILAAVVVSVTSLGLLTICCLHAWSRHA